MKNIIVLILDYRVKGSAVSAILKLPTKSMAKSPSGSSWSGESNHLRHAPFVNSLRASLQVLGLPHIFIRWMMFQPGVTLRSPSLHLTSLNNRWYPNDPSHCR